MEYLKLVGIPWEEANCAEIARRGFGLLGLELPESALPADQDAGAVAVASLQGQEGPWRFVGSTWRDARKPGRVILSSAEGGRLHVSLAMTENVALSSARPWGSFCAPISRIQNILGVYELR